MNPWFANSAILLASIVLIAIRAPHGQRSLEVPVALNKKGALEFTLLTIAWFAFFVPLLWIATPLFAAADYQLLPIPFIAGCACYVLGLWVFHRSHADLGTNWSMSLELREKHVLITDGIYGRIRHPMYLSLLLYSAGQALVLPNYIAGPSYALAMGLLCALRVRPEENMMLEEFGKDYEVYMSRTKRLLPGIW